jgi:hypothetical protein
MKQKDYIILHTEYKNNYGESMKLVLDEYMEMWFYHSDCNHDYEKISDLITTKKKHTFSFNYILSSDEQIVLQNFINTCDEMINEKVN